MNLERSQPEVYNRRKALESYRHRQKTPEVPAELPTTPDNVGQTVIIKKSESKLQKKKGISNNPEKSDNSRILGPEDFGIDMEQLAADAKRLKNEPTS